MSNAYSENIAWQICEARRDSGQTVVYESEDYKVRTKPVAGAECGVQGLPKEIKDNLDVYIAALDPRVFRFSPDEFAPTTDVPVPCEQKLLVWYSLTYLITRVTFDDAGDDTNAIDCYCLRKIW